MIFMKDETPSSRGVGRPTFAQWFRARHPRTFLPVALTTCLTVLYTVIFFNSEAISDSSLSLGHFVVATVVFLFIGTVVFYSLYWRQTKRIGTKESSFQHATREASSNESEGD